MLRKLVFFIILTVIGLVILVGSFIWINHTSNFLDQCLETKGIVVQLNWDYDEGVAHAYPVFQFINQNTGEEITAQGSSGSNPPDYHVGQEVDILYNPENPYDVKVNSFWDIWGGPIILAGLGFVFLTVGLVNLALIVRLLLQ